MENASRNTFGQLLFGVRHYNGNFTRSVIERKINSSGGGGGGGDGDDDGDGNGGI